MADISKIDMDRINGLLDKLNSMKYVVETWNEGNEWYRVWSDGWIEQGGMYDSGTDSGDKFPEIFLNKPFKNITYTLMIVPYQSYTSYPNVRIHNQLVNYFIPVILNTRYIRWYACGY